MVLEIYREFIKVVEGMEEHHIFQLKLLNGELVTGKIVGINSPTVFFGDVESGGHPTQVTIDVLPNVYQPIGKKIALSVVEIDNYEVLKSTVN